MQHNPAPLKLHFTTVGSGPAVLLVHGMADDSSVWDATVAAAGPNLACTTVDLPGHGRSPTPSEEAAYRREAVLDALDGVLAQIGPAVMVGHLLGGYLALVHHLTRPGVLRGLVLVSTGPGFRDAEAMQRWNDRVHANTPNLDMAPVAATISLHTDSLVIERLSEVSIPVGAGGGKRGSQLLRRQRLHGNQALRRASRHRGGWASPGNAHPSRTDRGDDPPGGRRFGKTRPFQSRRAPPSVTPLLDAGSRHFIKEDLIP